MNLSVKLLQTSDMSVVAFDYGVDMVI